VLPDDDQAAEYAAAWAIFEALERAAPHRADWRAWAAGRGQHTLLMAIVREAAAVRAISEVQGSLAGIQGLELHQPHFFHISIQSCGFDDALAIDSDSLEAALRKMPSFAVRLGGVNAFHSAVFLETHGGGRLLALRQALRTALGPGLDEIDPHTGLLFHLTVGYLSDEAPLDAVRAVIRPLRAREIGAITVDRVDLVQVPTDQQVPFPVLEPLRSFRLAGR
jgi:2'-5' RNA ligase